MQDRKSIRTSFSQRKTENRFENVKYIPQHRALKAEDILHRLLLPSAALKIHSTMLLHYIIRAAVDPALIGQFQSILCATPEHFVLDPYSTTRAVIYTLKGPSLKSITLVSSDIQSPRGLDTRRTKAVLSRYS